MDNKKLNDRQLTEYWICDIDGIRLKRYTSYSVALRRAMEFSERDKTKYEVRAFQAKEVKLDELRNGFAEPTIRKACQKFINMLDEYVTETSVLPILEFELSKVGYRLVTSSRPLRIELKK